MKVRKATESDYPLIAAMANRIWKTVYPEIITMEQIEYMLEWGYSETALSKQVEAQNHFYLLEDEAAPMGYLSWSRTGDREVFIHKFYIDVSVHRRGAGTFFLHEVRKDFNPDDVIRLTVNRKNYRAINFYFKNGFIIQEVKDFDIGHGFVMNDFIMVNRPDRAEI